MSNHIIDNKVWHHSSRLNWTAK